MTFNLWTFLFEIVNFVVLAYVLHRLLYHPLRNAVEERREATNKAQADTEAAQQEAAALEQKLNTQMADLERQRQDAIRQAREQAEAERKKILADTEQTVQRHQEDSRKALAQEREEALESLQAEVIDQAAALAERFLGEAVNATLNQQLAVKLIDLLRRLPASEREDLKRQWKPADGAVLETAKELDEATVHQFTEMLTAVLGQQVTLNVHTQTNLIGGVRLRLGGRVWDASLSGALQPVRHADSEVAGHVEKTQQVREELRGRFARIHWQVREGEVGWITRAGDGVAYVRGAASVRYGELLKRADGLTALAFDLRPNEVGVLFLDVSEHVAAGDELQATGKVATVPVGPELLGRVVDALGRPLDDGTPIRSAKAWPVEREAPGVIDRQPVREPMHTGTKVIDALLPLGRGQRELILGDRATGKTSIALDAILAQRDTGVVCVYCAIGQRNASVAETIDLLSKQDALRHTAIVVADADSPAGQQYLAPYTACTIGEYFMHQGKHVLVVYDDLTKHADAYRRISLLLGRPPGREAYPADVFYLHSRLLERATRLHDRLGGGSLTALPIAMTQAGNISSYIPTNLISITDGQIYLDSRLFNEGLRPAVDVGLSVSRVGGKAQPTMLRKLAGDLRLLYAQLHEMETFARFGAELEPETRRRLERGRRLREALKQPRLRPWRLAHEVAVLFAIREGYLDPIAVEQVSAFLSTLVGRLDELGANALTALENDHDANESVQSRLRQLFESVQHTFQAVEKS